MSPFRISNLEAGGQHLQDIEDQEMGQASDPSYYTLKKSMKGKKINVPRKSTAKYLRKKDHVSNIDPKKFDADAPRSNAHKYG